MRLANQAEEAEISWRTGFCIRFKAALAVDMLNKQGDAVAEYTLKEAAGLYREAKLLIELTDSLESRLLRIHPIVCGRSDIVQLASECMTICGPATCHEIYRYFNMNKSSKHLLRSAYFAAPWSRRLRYEICSSNLYNIQAVVTVDSLSDEKPWWTAESMYFTTHTGMAIGHYSIVIDFLELCLRKKWPVEIWIIETGSDVDFGVKSLMVKRYPNVRFCKASVIDDMSLEELAGLQDAHFRHYWMNSEERAQTYDCLKEIRKNKHISMHLRSSRFRNDSNNRATNIRSVNQYNYQEAVNILVSEGYSVSQITAEAEAIGLENAELVNVTRLPFRVQWETIEKSCFILGTPSGISHFSALTSFATLMTNWTGMPSENILGEYSLVACKRFFFKSNITLTTRAELLGLFVNFWINEPVGLEAYVDIRDLDENELAAATREYIRLVNGQWNGKTLYSIIEMYKIRVPTNRIQNWKLSESTSSDLQALLESCKMTE